MRVVRPDGIVAKNRSAEWGDIIVEMTNTDSSSKTYKTKFVPSLSLLLQFLKKNILSLIP